MVKRQSEKTKRVVRQLKTTVFNTQMSKPIVQSSASDSMRDAASKIEEERAWRHAGFDVIPIYFAPDWSRRFTRESVERELRNFQYRGPGWYFTPTDTILITPLAVDDKLCEIFTVHVWNSPAVGGVETGNPIAMLSWVANAPVRFDTRK